MQMAALLEEDIKTGGDFCTRVVDLAVEVADTTVLLSLNAAKSLGQDSVSFAESSSLFAAEIACYSEQQSAQAQLDEQQLSQDGSSILTVPNPDASTPDGAIFLINLPIEVLIS